MECCYEEKRGYKDRSETRVSKMYVNGMGLRGIERFEKVDHTTVINWVNKSERICLIPTIWKQYPIS